MNNVLVMTSSIRQVRAADGILAEVTALLQQRDVDVTVADLREIQLPLLDSTMPPASPDFTTDHEAVHRWSDLVTQSSAVLMLASENNRAITAAHKNALDWLSQQWRGKPIGVIGYGVYGSVHVRHNLRDILGSMGATYLEPDANLSLGEAVNGDGTVKSRELFDLTVTPVLDKVVAAAKGA